MPLRLQDTKVHKEILSIIYTQNKLVCEKCLHQCTDFEYNEDIIFLKENYRQYKFRDSLCFCAFVAKTYIL